MPRSNNGRNRPKIAGKNDRFCFLLATSARSFILYPLVFNVVFDHGGHIATGKRREMGGGKEEMG
jgi:hypothetical protein